MIEIAIITAPRKRPTLQKTLNSLRRAGFNSEITIFAEPETKHLPLEGVYWLYNEVKHGCFKNYTQALWYLATNSGSPYIGVFSDDFKYARNTYRDLSKRCIDLCEDGYVATYTPLGMKRLMPLKGVNTINEGWGVTWGGNYVFSKENAVKILEHDLYRDHYENYEKNQQVDHIIPKVCKELGINQNFLNPSLCDHIGFNSTIGHTHTLREKGLNFRD